MFLSLEGIDGSGKSTLCQLVGEARPELKTESRRHVVSSSKFVEPIQKNLAEILWVFPESRDLSSTFWLYLQAAWHVLLAETTLRTSAPVLMDGWYFKFFARLEHQGYDSAALSAAFGYVPRPDHVVLLDVSPAVAWNRKIFRSTELGLHSNHLSEDPFERFQAYQVGTMTALRRAADLHGWSVISVDDDESVEDTLAHVLVAIDSAVAKEGA